MVWRWPEVSLAGYNVDSHASSVQKNNPDYPKPKDLIVFHSHLPHISKQSRVHRVATIFLGGSPTRLSGNSIQAGRALGLSEVSVQ